MPWDRSGRTRRTGPPAAPAPARPVPAAARKPAELPVEAEVDVEDVARRPPVEEVLAVRLHGLEHLSVEPGRAGGEPPLWRRHRHWPAGQRPRVLPRQRVD